MHRFFISRNDVIKDDIRITGDDVAHISKVLRLRPGDKISACDGEGNEFICTISSLDKKCVMCSIIEKGLNRSEPILKARLYQGIPKSTKMDLIIQKCTELGIEEVVPVKTERVIVKVENEKDLADRVSRWQRIAEEAAKQSNRGHIPKIFEPVSFVDAIQELKEYDLAIVPYEKEDTTSLKEVLKGKNNINSIGILIGPEGGFSDNEITISQENNIIPVTLGPRILRTETAGFACLAIVMYELGDMGVCHG